MAAIKQHKACFVFQKKKKKNAFQITGAAARSLNLKQLNLGTASGSDVNLTLFIPAWYVQASSAVQSGGSESLISAAASRAEEGRWWLVGGGVESRQSGRMVCSAASCLRLFGAAVLSGTCNQIPFPVPQLEFAASFPGNETLN